MSNIKTALKAAKAALDAQRYQDAADEANKVLAIDPKNYHANVFIGLALDKQDENEGSEAAYNAATQIRPKDTLAWQGMITLFEKQAGRRLDVYHDAAVHLAAIYMEEDDRIRCQTVIDKYTLDAKKYGSRAQLKHSLEVLLPSSTVYGYLEGRIPQPALTFAKIADIVQTEEKERINTEIGQRRTRLGAKIDQVTADVRREVFENSPLEELYTSIIEWTHDDEVRRRYEEMMLQHAGDTLAVLPLVKKPSKRQQVQKLAQGLVILKHPYLLAWRIALEWSDVEEIKQLDAGILREFIALFPDEGLSKVLRGYLESDISPFPKEIPTDHDGAVIEDDAGPLTSEGRLMLMTEGMEECSFSILSHRLMGQYYLRLDEHESAATVAKAGLNHIASESRLSGLSFEHSYDALNTILATALVQYQAPRHHSEAKGLFESILARKPTETSALLGIGTIYEEQESYSEAVKFLERALKRNSDPKIRAEAAWCRAMNGDNEIGLQELEACLSQLQASDTRTKALRSQTLYRIGICIWTQNASSAARKDRSGAYARFLASIQADMNFAPAYTSLGIYYADYARDRKRARKCFQKAFELSASEVEAAERLARSFAKSGEWDLVEVVSQRVVDSGKVRPAPGSKRKGLSWPFAALGVVQLNNQEYAKSIISFQSALRTSPTDYHSWVGLGESYHNSGRHIAATKAFEHAQQLVSTPDTKSTDHSWFLDYMLANVKREIGDYEDAISGYQRVLSVRPAEFGVSIALLQSLVEGAWRNIELGFYGRAADRAREAVRVAQDIIKMRSDAFNLWKSVGDVCSIFARVQAYTFKCPLQDLRSLLEADVDLDIFDLLADVDGTGKEALQSFSDNDGTTASSLSSSLRAAILAQKRAIHTCANDFHARAVAWYNLGWTQHQAHVYGLKEPMPVVKKSSLRHLKAAVRCFKGAIELEAGNAEFWNSLGIVTTELNPKVAQHSFVRSLYLNDKNARVWTNLGTLYLIQGDPQLANEAFARAQSTDPDYPQAWLGQGLLAAHTGDAGEARNLFTHAFEIADSSSTLIKQRYSMSTFDNLVSPSPSSITTEVLQPLFALHQLRSQISSDIPVQHLLALFAERVGDYADATSALNLICSKLEADYESSESPVTLMRFAQARADLARALLAEKDFGAAAENAETATDLLEDENGSNLNRQKVRLSAHMTAGLAYYYQGSMDNAIDMFKSALTESQGNPDVVCLLSQVLWAKGGDNERDVAREQLLDCIEKHPGHVGATSLLGVIAILDEDRETLEAVTADLETLRTKDYLNLQERNKVAHLLTTIATLYPTDGPEGASDVSQATTAIMLAPSQPQGWSQLAALKEDGFSAEMAVITAVKSVPPRGALEAQDLCKSYSGTGRLDDAQRAIMLAPWFPGGWDAFL